MPSAQQPLLPVQHGSPSPAGGSRRPGSLHSSPAKDMLLSRGRAAAVAVLRSPWALVAGLAALLSVVALAAWLLPQQPLSGLAAQRSGTGAQRHFFEELTEQEQRQLALQQHHTQREAAAQQQRLRQQEESSGSAAVRSIDDLARPQPLQPSAGGESVSSQDAFDGQGGAAGGAAGGEAGDGEGQPGAPGATSAEDGNTNTSSSNDVIDIHEVAKVPPLFGSR